jgi:hypothetical protein
MSSCVSLAGAKTRSLRVVDTGTSCGCDGTHILTSQTGRISHANSGDDSGSYAPNSACKWSIIAAQTVVLTFDLFNLESCHDFVKVYDGAGLAEGSDRGDDGNLLGAFSGNNIPSSISSPTGKMVVVFSSDASTETSGFSASYRVVQQAQSMATGAARCAGLVTLYSSSGSVSDGAGRYAPNARCRWRIISTSRIRLTFEEFSLESDFDRLEVYDGPDDNTAQLLATLSGGARPQPIESLASSLFLVFSSDASVESTGFTASFVSIPSVQIGVLMPQHRTLPPCGGNLSLTAPAGYISSGITSVNLYAPRSRCLWTISAPVGVHVRLVFDYFDIECGHDYLRIYDRMESVGRSVLAALSGSSLPQPIISETGTMFLEFSTDSSGQRLGFGAMYAVQDLAGGWSTVQPSAGVTLTPTHTPTIVPSEASALFVRPHTWAPSTEAPAFPSSTELPSCTCSAMQSVNFLPATISDGSSPGVNYADGTQCSWRVQMMSNVQLRFESFDLESGYDWLKVYEGSESSGVLLSSHTGQDLPSTQQFPASIFIQFSADSSVTRSGFVAIIEAHHIDPPLPIAIAAPSESCSGTLMVDLPAIITDGTGVYSNNVVCSWILNGAGPIAIHFSHFATEAGYDFVELYRGDTASASSLLGNFSGTRADFTQTVLSDRALITFRSDSSVTDQGFHATIMSVGAVGTSTPSSISPSMVPMAPSTRCNGIQTLQAATGTISDGIGPYNANMNCEWIIDVSGVELSFSAFSTESGYDFVTVYDGSLSQEIGRFSGTAIPSEVMSSGSLRVVFTSDGSVEDLGFTASYTVRSLPASPVYAPPSTIPTLESPNVLLSGVQCNGEWSVMIDSTTRIGLSNYLNSATCIWNLQASSQQQLSLTFTMLNTEAGYDFVRVYDSSDLKGSFSGSTLPPIIRSTRSSLAVHFYSDSSVLGEGFAADISTLP